MTVIPWTTSEVGTGETQTLTLHFLGQEHATDHEPDQEDGRGGVGGQQALHAHCQTRAFSRRGPGNDSPSAATSAPASA